VRGSRGHSLLRCAVDTEIEVVRSGASGIAIAAVTKQRDGPTEGSVSFKLRRIELGDNNDGEPVTSCVIEATDAPVEVRNSKQRLTAAAKIALNTLRKAVAEAGTPAPPSNHDLRV
jgi:hypothetical protein